MKIETSQEHSDIRDCVFEGIKFCCGLEWFVERPVGISRRQEPTFPPGA